MSLDTLEKIGPAFSIGALMAVRKKTQEAVRLIGEQIKPGIGEEKARHLARGTLTLSDHFGLAQEFDSFWTEYDQRFSEAFRYDGAPSRQ